MRSLCTCKYFIFSDDRFCFRHNLTFCVADANRHIVALVVLMQLQHAIYRKLSVRGNSSRSDVDMVGLYGDLTVGNISVCKKISA